MRYRHLLLVASLMVSPLAIAQPQVSVGISLPGISIGINQPAYPQLVVVPGTPVYYAPGANSNYFFYDGMYWVFYGDDWYASSWYNGPWHPVARAAVPVYLWRVPVRYWRAPPPYFHGWHGGEPPHWDEHWGHDWHEQHAGWNQWDHRSAPPPAPLPHYQRQYSGQKYPQEPQQQHVVRDQNYHYEPHEDVVRQHWQAQREEAQHPHGPPQEHGEHGKGEHHEQDRF
ncbi:MAG TPA: hypothetical protein VMT50_01550 [Steroidobacteraceae bacterium]|nr:hypothetical protein [Steroidobacteraceae bacterium]